MNSTDALESPMLSKAVSTGRTKTNESPSLADANPAAPRLLEKILHRCLEKTPGDRYDSAAELHGALKDLRQQLVTGELDHPNIVPIYDLGANDQGALFYSMKRVRGTPWNDVLQEKSLDENLTIADVEGLIAERAESGFTDLAATFTPLVTPDVLSQLSETSDFFRLKVIVRVDTVRITFYSMMERSVQGDVTPILRSLGTT